MIRLPALVVVAFLCGANHAAVAQQKDIEFWIAELKSGDPLAQEEAVAVLGKLGPKARPALDTLANLAAKSTPLLSRKATAAIFRIDPDASVPATPLLDGLKAAAVEERMQTLAITAPALVQSRSLTKAVLKALPQLDPETAQLVLERMAASEPHIYAVVEEALGHKDATVRAGALFIAGRMPAQAKDSVPRIRSLLKDDDLRVRFEAARIVWQLDAKKDPDALLAIVKEAAADNKLQPTALAFTMTIRPPLEDTTLYRLALVKGSANLRLDAIELLQGKPSKELYPVALDIVQNDAKLRLRGVRLIARLFPEEAKDSVAVWLELFRRPHDPQAGGEVYKLLAKCGPATITPIVTLIKESTDPAKEVRELRWVLSRMGAPALDPVAELLDASNLEHRKTALQILGAMGPAAKKVAPRVRDFLDDPKLSYVAARALGDIAAGARELVPELSRRVLRNEGNSHYLLEPLFHIFPEPDVLLPLLRKVAKEHHPTQREKALTMLWQIEGDPKALALLLKGQWEKKTARVSYDAAKLVKMLGQDAALLLPDIIAQLHGNGFVDSQALTLLLELAPKVKYQPSQEEVKTLLATFDKKRLGTYYGYDFHRVNAAVILLGFGVEKDKAIQVLKEELPKAERPPWHQVLNVFASYGPRLKPVAPEILAWAGKAGNDGVLVYRCLLSIDPDLVKELPPGLEKKLRDSPSLYQHLAPELLMNLKINDEKSWVGFARGLDQGNPLQTLRMLENYGARAKSLAPKVEKHLTHEDDTVRLAAGVTLAKMTGQAEKSVPVMLEIVKNRFSWHAGNELRRLGPGASVAVPELMATAEKMPGHTAKMLREFAFDINRQAAFDWWQKRDRK